MCKMHAAYACGVTCTQEMHAAEARGSNMHVGDICIRNRHVAYACGGTYTHATYEHGSTCTQRSYAHRRSTHMPHTGHTP